MNFYVLIKTFVDIQIQKIKFILFHKYASVWIREIPFVDPNILTCKLLFHTFKTNRYIIQNLVWYICFYSENTKLQCDITRCPYIKLTDVMSCFECTLWSHVNLDSFQLLQKKFLLQIQCVNRLFVNLMFSVNLMILYLTCLCKVV